MEELYESEDEGPCLHEDYDVDILTCIAACSYCNHRWFMSKESFSEWTEWKKESESSKVKICAASGAQLNFAVGMALNLNLHHVDGEGGIAVRCDRSEDENGWRWLSSKELSLVAPCLDLYKAYDGYIK
jgi:hypothetical protein